MPNIYPCPKPPKKRGKRKKAKFNRKAVIKRFEALGITKCEVVLPGCEKYGETPAHRLKRRLYVDDRINSYKEIVIACPYCHEILEQDPKLTRETFNRLRPTNAKPNKQG